MSLPGRERQMDRCDEVIIGFGKAGNTLSATLRHDAATPADDFQER